MNNPKVSVIVPVYNVEKLLQRCIDSILVQTFTDFELLLIDDGSKDKSGEICDEYAAKDARIRVFHKQNGGVSSTRNLGIDEAKGKYIAFVDSDDFLDNDYFEQLVRQDGDLIFCGFKSAGGKPHQFVYPNRVVVDDEIGSCMAEYLADTPVGVPWSKLFKSELLKQSGLRFEESLFWGEDHVFVMNFLMFCKTLVFINYAGYNYYCPPVNKKYLLNEKQVLNYLEKEIGTLRELCVTFRFGNQKFMQQAYAHSLGCYIDYQQSNYKYSWRDYAIYLDFVRNIELPQDVSSSVFSKPVRALLGTIKDKKYMVGFVLIRFVLPLYNVLKTIIRK